MECKKALQEAGGDKDKALRILRERGLAGAKKLAGRATKEGMVDAYIHMGGKVGVLVEVNCETDFVARNEQFKTLVHDVALHIAAASPAFVEAEDVPEELLAQEKEIYRNQALAEGKPEQFVEKIVEGRLKKYYEQFCLMNQPFVREPEITVRDLVTRTIQATGENISVRRFVRYQLGEELPCE
jgi:elongation factor Ts